MTAIPSWLPNAISAARIALVPVWGLLAEGCRAAALAGGDPAPWRRASVAVLLAIGLSDVGDGQLARRFGLTTRMGATLDAFADKLTQVALVTFLTFRGAPAFPELPLWFLVVLVGRDLLLGLGWLWARRRLHGDVEVVHRLHGKAASAVLFGVLLLTTADASGPVLMPALVVLASWIALSNLAYVRAGLQQVLRRSAPNA